MLHVIKCEYKQINFTFTFNFNDAEQSLNNMITFYFFINFKEIKLENT